MNEELREEVYRLFAEHRVNVELLFAGDDDYTPPVTVRVRPWRNLANGSQMILAAALTVDDALLWAMRGLLAEQWIPLQWQQRCRIVGVLTPELLKEASKAAPLPRRNVSAALLDTFGRNDTPTASNGPQNGSQEHAGHSSKELRSKK